MNTAKTRQKRAKKRSLLGINEHFERVFNAVFTSAVVMLRSLFTISLLLLTPLIYANEALYDKFVGKYSGHIELDEDQIRDLEVEIKSVSKGFNVSWKTIKSDQAGSGKTKTYSIDFVESDRSGIYGSAMKTNLFGGQEALDPIKGEPYFWARITDNTLTVYGMFITESGDYEIQRYDRTVVGEKMSLKYTLATQNKIVKTINAELQKQTQDL